MYNSSFSTAPQSDGTTFESRGRGLNNIKCPHSPKKWVMTSSGLFSPTAYLSWRMAVIVVVAWSLEPVKAIDSLFSWKIKKKSSERKRSSFYRQEYVVTPYHSNLNLNFLPRLWDLNQVPSGYAWPLHHLIYLHNYNI